MYNNIGGINSGMHEHASKMELGDKETSYMHLSMSVRNTSLYTRIVRAIRV